MTTNHIDLTASPPPPSAPAKARNGHTLPPNNAVPLDIAIDTVQVSTLRRVVKQLCHDDATVRALFASQLMTPFSSAKLYDTVSTDEAGSTDEETTNEDDAAAQATKPPPESTDSKRENGQRGSSHHQGDPAKDKTVLLPRYVSCAQCEEEFDVAKNDREACRWHPGEMEPQEDCGDMNPCDPDLNEPGAKEDFAEFFNWTCCGAQGDEEGCKVSPHRRDDKEMARERLEDDMKQGARKRRRVE